MSVANTPDRRKLRSAPLAFQNDEFLMSREGRGVRLLAEYVEFPYRMQALGIRGTFLFFGSARSKYREDWECDLATAREQLARAGATPTEIAAAEARVAGLCRIEWMCPWMLVTQELARLLTAWSLSDEGREIGLQCGTHNPLGGRNEQPLIVCSGGGPGFMEAANKGAAEVPGAVNMGVAVTLPFESGINPYVSPGFEFRYEYFFSRKFMEVFMAKAVICAPGGMGTCDELFECLTLMQVNHCPKMPIVLLGKEFWTTIINFNAMAKFGVVTQKEVDELCITDSAEEAFDFIVQFLRKEVHDGAQRTTTPPPQRR